METAIWKKSTLMFAMFVEIAASIKILLRIAVFHPARRVALAVRRMNKMDPGDQPVRKVVLSRP